LEFIELPPLTFDDNDPVRLTKDVSKKRISIEMKIKIKILLGKRLVLCSFPLDSRLAIDEPPLEYVSSPY
jgi:hypothetical protein